MFPARPLFFVAILLLVSPTQSFAVIKKLTPLSETLMSKMIFVAEVESVSPEKPAVVFKTIENLQGKAPAEKFIVNLTGDTFAKKDKHSEVMLDRLEPGRKLILFMSPREDDFSVFGYLEGTWFQMRGATTNGKTVWQFLHCEPYFRRTFKGTTAELQKVLTECIAGKAKPPEPDEKEPHGYGPPIEKKKQELPKKEDKQCSRNGRQLPVGFVSGPLFGVIPSFVLVGPLAILSALFPTVFAGFASGLKRWRAFLVIASINSILTGVYVLIRDELPGSRFFTPFAITGYVVWINLVGIAWAGRRYRRDALADASITAAPQRAEVITLACFALAVTGILALLAWGFGLARTDLIEMPTREFTAIGVGLIAAWIHAIYRRATRNVDAHSSSILKLSAPGEAVGIAGMFLLALGMLIHQLPSEGGSRTVTVELGEAASTTAIGPTVTDANLWYEDAEVNRIFSALGVSPSRIYFGGTVNQFGFDAGVLICVERSSGKRLWKFTDKNLKTVFATPVVHDGKLYFGEGLHTDSDCRMICLNAETGEKIWQKVTASHTEGTPAISDGKVFFSAGDDGIYCCDAKTGDEIWHYTGGEKPLHIDTPVVVQDGKLYGGSGYNHFAAFCLDASNGKEIWRKELPLRSFGAPLLLGKTIVYGVGTGNLTEDLSSEPEPNRTPETKPAGMLICRDTATGNEVWKIDLPKSVHTKLAADARAIYACCKDGSIYSFDRKTGKQIWKIALGTELTAGPAIATMARGFATIAIYAASKDGNVYALDAQTGNVFWMRPIIGTVQRKAEIMSRPVIVNRAEDGSTREIFFPATLTNLQTAQVRGGIVRFVDEIRE